MLHTHSRQGRCLDNDDSPNIPSLDPSRVGAGRPMTVRIDKWLWAARFFKTRTLAQDAVDGGRVRMNGDRVKPAKEVRPGDAIAIRIGEYEWSVVVTALADKRGSADIARTLYSETEASAARRAAQVADRRAQVSGWAVRAGRPTKRDRREIDRLRGGE
jgi:ribosome-associated heat shock protein Hsp15